jgi:hypothetical protein
VHQGATLPATPLLVVDPQLRDVQPAPADVSKQPSDDSAVVCTEKDPHGLFAWIAEAAHVERA